MTTWTIPCNACGKQHMRGAGVMKREPLVPVAGAVFCPPCAEKERDRLSSSAPRGFCPRCGSRFVGDGQIKVCEDACFLG